MPHLCDTLLCSGCGACASICPKSAISMIADEEGFLRPSINESNCIECGRCVKACPILHPFETSQNVPDCWAAYNLADQERDAASSGGVFQLLARWILNKHGVVFGAAFKDDFSVTHTFAQSEQELAPFFGSKYVQSSTGDSFKQAKTFLDQGRYVLYSGTPCQIHGLLHFLGKNYPKLLTVDMICHGTPSPAVWQRYVQERTALDGGEKPTQIQFRAKPLGWCNFSMVFSYGESRYAVSHRQDPYMRGFLRDLYLRPSCHNCSAKGIHRPADITLADFWGADRFCPELVDDKGLSLILVHSEKGSAVWTDIAPQMRIAPVGQEAAIQNVASIHSVSPHPNRKEFFCRFHNCDSLSDLIKTMTPDPIDSPPSFYRRIRGKLGRILRRWIG